MGQSMIQQLELGFMFHQFSAKGDGDATCAIINTISGSTSKPSEVFSIHPMYGTQSWSICETTD